MTNLVLSLLVWVGLMLAACAAGVVVLAGAWVAQSVVEFVSPGYVGRRRS